MGNSRRGDHRRARSSASNETKDDRWGDSGDPVDSRHSVRIAHPPWSEIRTY
jgi:hypothetical protein